MGNVSDQDFDIRDLMALSTVINKKGRFLSCWFQLMLCLQNPTGSVRALHLGVMQGHPCSERGLVVQKKVVWTWREY